MYLLPNPFAMPFAKVEVHRRIRGKVMRQHFPLASRALHVEDGVEDFSKVHFTGTTKALTSRYQRLQNAPFGITHIAGIGFALGIGDFW